ncbi:unnamed protein product [Prorocentrum cordatum]|uniref:Uncharacterized protein n=1 Tax=Prorocentrum cordatum TaxID=2364126 RepID=A0ABN9TG99_9DINO|nr:unnamed protein product [Polarella glacialis]
MPRLGRDDMQEADAELRHVTARRSVALEGHSTIRGKINPALGRDAVTPSGPPGFDAVTLGRADPGEAPRRGACMRLAGWVLLTCASGGRGADNGLGITPPMGWRSWNSYGRRVNQSLMEGIMDGMVRRKWKVDGVPTSLCDLEGGTATWVWTTAGRSAARERTTTTTTTGGLWST